MEATNGSSSPHLNTQEFTRDQDLWLEDGDMVFSAETKVFRVRGRQLASISSVFGAMLSFPQPDPVDTFDTYPLIRMQDSAEDVRCFFKAIFSPAYFAPPPAHTDVKTLIAVLRLAHKYEAISLSHCALLHLATAYPTKLRAWDSRNETRTFPPCRLFSEEFQLLRLAYKHGATWTLPSLFYGCSAYPMNEILDSPVWTEADDLTLEKTLCLLGYAEQFSSSHRNALSPSPGSSAVYRDAEVLSQ
ncbi:hypothetical protein H0H81_011079 [Sphagnurus paluster]|uniref:BTB domain-containing protein n=1 Tax=Sphagnurus paluster TaxID=117069 RepID=A0A9P7GIS7_9AGAR|nr:hypothetical protein H0H81_011079 [Sphagnurus paluster]